MSEFLKLNKQDVLVDLPTRMVAVGGMLAGKSTCVLTFIDKLKEVAIFPENVQKTNILLGKFKYHSAY